MELAEAVETRPDAELEAFGALVMPLRGAAWQLAASVLRDQAEAEDVVQEACVKAWRRHGSLRDQQAFRAWFLAIVANQARTAARRQRRRDLLSSVLAVLRSHGEPEQRMASDLAVRTAIARLPLHQRQVVVLHYHFGRSAEQIAELLGLPVGTVKSRLNRAVSRLRGYLGEDWS